MATLKYVLFLNDLVSMLDKKGRDPIKLILGDSIGNNRTLTVNQVIRFLTRKGAPTAQKRMGKQLVFIYDLLRSDILVNRSVFTARTDALDINEFVNTYTDLVVNGTTPIRRVVGRSLAA